MTRLPLWQSSAGGFAADRELKLSGLARSHIRHESVNPEKLVPSAKLPHNFT
jgi:hypothetical protein